MFALIAHFFFRGQSLVSNWASQWTGAKLGDVAGAQNLDFRQMRAFKHARRMAAGIKRVATMTGAGPSFNQMFDGQGSGHDFNSGGTPSIGWVNNTGASLSRCCSADRPASFPCNAWPGC